MQILNVYRLIFLTIQCLLYHIGALPWPEWFVACAASLRSGLLVLQIVICRTIALQNITAMRAQLPFCLLMNIDLDKKMRDW